MAHIFSQLRISAVLALASFAILHLTLALPTHPEGHLVNATEVGSKSTEGTDADVDLDFNQVRFHTESQKYYRVGSTEPCQENMRFFAVPNETRIGQCDCDYYQCSRPLLYNKRTGNCHWAWSRGPCGEGEWYTFTDKLRPICEKNVCPENADVDSVDYYFKNPQDGKCYQAGTRGYCTGADERLMIYPNEPIPSCRTSTVCYPLTVPAQQLCIQGNRRHYDGFCDGEL